MKRSKGFTIIELLVATAVFAIVLVVITTAILQVTRVYYKGITEASTQNTARSIIDLISQGIQFSGEDVTTTPASPTPGSSYAFCVAGQRFSFTTGYQVMDSPVSANHQSYHALVADTYSGCSSGTPAQDMMSSSTPAGRELVPPRMRISKLSVTNIGPNLYKVQVRIVYGDDDVLTNPTSANAVCQSVSAGTQFCAVSDLSTVVIKRVQ